jgi:hypothetical protein
VLLAEKATGNDYRTLNSSRFLPDAMSITSQRGTILAIFITRCEESGYFSGFQGNRSICRPDLLRLFSESVQTHSDGRKMQIRREKNARDRGH